MAENQNNGQKDQKFGEAITEGVDIGEGEFGKIELPTLDVTPYVGKKVKIEQIKKYKGEFGYYLKIITEVVDENIDFGDGQKLRASRIFGLQQNEAGEWGYGSETKLGLYLKKKGVDDPAKLKNIEVVVQTITGNDGKDYLTFN